MKLKMPKINLKKPLSIASSTSVPTIGEFLAPDVDLSTGVIDNEFISVDLRNYVLGGTVGFEVSDDWVITTYLSKYIDSLAHKRLAQKQIAERASKGISYSGKRRLEEELAALNANIARLGAMPIYVANVATGALRRTNSAVELVTTDPAFTFFFSDYKTDRSFNLEAPVIYTLTGEATSLQTHIDSETTKFKLADAKIFSVDSAFKLTFDIDQVKFFVNNRHTLATCVDMINNMLLDNSTSFSSLLDRGPTMKKKLLDMSIKYPVLKDYKFLKGDFINSLSDLYNEIFTVPSTVSISVNDIDLVEIAEATGTAAAISRPYRKIDAFIALTLYGADVIGNDVSTKSYPGGKLTFKNYSYPLATATETEISRYKQVLRLCLAVTNFDFSIESSNAQSVMANPFKLIIKLFPNVRWTE